MRVLRFKKRLVEATMFLMVLMKMISWESLRLLKLIWETGQKQMGCLLISDPISKVITMMNLTCLQYLLGVHRLRMSLDCLRCHELLSRDKFWRFSLWSGATNLCFRLRVLITLFITFSSFLLAL